VSPLQLAGGAATEFETAAGDLLPLAAPAPGTAAGEKLEFRCELLVQGSERLEIVPVGKATTVQLGSVWPDPSFCGACLPVQRSVTAEGFSAKWEAAHFSQEFPRSWSSRDWNPRTLLAKLDAAGFGVQLAQPVDGYRLSERAEKYGVLFFVLVFAVCFLFETTAQLRIHPLQYGLVGAGLCLFFLAFLALAELVPVPVAYALAAAACTALITLYAWSFLQTGARTVVVAAGLAATYGYLYFVVQSQDYALIAGTAALFALLALVMFGTRRLNWYALGGAAAAQSSAPCAPAAGLRPTA